MNYFIESLLNELDKFEYSEQSPATYNGVKESQGYEFYYHKILVPLRKDFDTGISQFHMSEGLNQVPPARIIGQLQTLIQRVEKLIQENESRSIRKRWNKELENIDLSEKSIHHRFQTLKFLLSASNCQIQIAKDSIDIVRPLIQVLENPDKSPFSSKGEQKRKVSKHPKFILTDSFSSSRDRTFLTDLRNDLIAIEKLSKDDPNNTLANFKSFFVSKGEVSSKRVKPIKFYGQVNELQHLIYVLNDVLIVNNYSSQSNYRTAFMLFVDENGDKFSPKKERWSEAPAFAKATKIESVLSGLRRQDSKIKNKKN